MSVDVTWPTQKSEYDKAAIDCLRSHLSDDGIDLNWSDTKYGGSEVALIPTSHQGARLVSKENMR